MDDAVFNYRCPGCHRIVEKEQLFSAGCPLCGWMSRLGDSLKTDKGSRKSAERSAPLLEVFDEDGCIVVLVEMPGFAEDEIKVRALNRLLILSAHGSGHRFYRRVMLPNSTIGEPKARYKNGVLKVTLRKGLHGR